jgi:hypothetical protein
MLGNLTMSGAPGRSLRWVRSLRGWRSRVAEAIPGPLIGHAGRLARGLPSVAERQRVAGILACQWLTCARPSGIVVGRADLGEIPYYACVCTSSE